MARYITTEVEVSLEDFDVQDLIDELEYSGYTVVKDAREAYQLTDDEIDHICDYFSRAKPGDIEYNIREKLRKR